jgi:hypothetical protein
MSRRGSMLPDLLPGLDLPEFPSPLPLWVTRVPRLAEWLHGGKSVLRWRVEVRCANPLVASA